ncbi:MAG TPA: AI-2E family transporter [Pirellulales bacterium]|nr:AI-2E family transporter [Pirellulales bacterium]
MTAIAALYVAKQILLPFALAVFLSFLLAPLVSRLERWKFPRVAAVLVAVALAFAGLGALGSTLFRQIYDFGDRLPEYEVNLIHKVQTFQGGEGGIVAKVSDAIQEMGEKLASERSGAQPPPKATSGRSQSGGAVGDAAPVRVEVIRPLSATDIAQGAFGPLVGPLGAAAMTIVFVIFMLIEREGLRNRLIHLIGARQLNLTTQALDDAAHRITRYLVMQLVVNAVFGAVIAAGLLLIGLPNALLWGVLAACLRFLPFLGPWIAATIPLALSLAVFDGWTRPLLVLGLFAVNELVSNNVLEPWLYGASTGISTIGILASAVFWTWLWGPVGLIMATPLTVCLTVIGRYVPQLALLNTLLSDQQPLSPHDRFYQRLLALDSDEAIEVAEEYLRGHSLEALYDGVLLPALRSAEEDRHGGELDESRLQFIHLTVRELVEDLGARESSMLAEGADAVPPEADSASDAAEIVCLPARDEADEIVAVMLAQLLAARRLKTEVISTRALASEMLGQVARHDPRVVCVSALPPFAATHARYLCKRLRPAFPGLPIVAGLWQASGGKKSQERLLAAGIDGFALTLADAAAQIVQLWSSRRATPVQAPVGANELDANRRQTAYGPGAAGTGCPAGSPGRNDSSIVAK